jgi:acetoin utilization protein AcuA
MATSGRARAALDRLARGLLECAVNPHAREATMDRYPQHDLTLATQEGKIRLRSFCRPEDIRRLRYDEGLAEDEHHRPLFRQERLAQAAAEAEPNVVLALEGDRIVGYGVLCRPGPEERWAALDEVMEVGAIETSRSRRGRGIAGALLNLLARHPRIEEWAVVVTGYSWSWDLAGSGLDAAGYRRMMVRLFARQGFAEHATNEPNLCLKPENVFLARIGAALPAAARQRFKWLCYGIKGNA